MYVCVCVCVCVCKYEKQGIEKTILFILKLMANVECFGFYIKPSSGINWVLLYLLNCI